MQKRAVEVRVAVVARLTRIKADVVFVGDEDDRKRGIRAIEALCLNLGELLLLKTFRERVHEHLTLSGAVFLPGAAQVFFECFGSLRDGHRLGVDHLGVTAMREETSRPAGPAVRKHYGDSRVSIGRKLGDESRNRARQAP